MKDLTKIVGKNLANEGMKLDLVTPDGDEMGISLLVKSASSKEGKAMIRKQTEKSAKKSARSKRETQEEVDKANSEFIDVLVVGGDKFKISKLEVDPANLSQEAKKAIIEDYSFILSQVVDFASNESNFYGELAGN